MRVLGVLPAVAYSDRQRDRAFYSIHHGVELMWEHWKSLSYRERLGLLAQALVGVCVLYALCFIDLALGY